MGSTHASSSAYPPAAPPHSNSGIPTAAELFHLIETITLVLCLAYMLFNMADLLFGLRPHTRRHRSHGHSAARLYVQHSLEAFLVCMVSITLTKIVAYYYENIGTLIELLMRKAGSVAKAKLGLSDVP